MVRPAGSPKLSPSSAILYPLGMGLPKLPCSPGAGARPPLEISPGARSPGTEPSALEVWGGEMGAPNCAVNSLHALKTADSHHQ